MCLGTCYQKNIEMVSPEIRDKYQEVIGLEIHVQLLTNTKAYSSDPNEYGSLPNTNVSVITLAHPGTLPRSNKQVFNHAIKLGLALNGEITEVNRYDRKNYFYPDLPKGYQVTQDATPIVRGGFVDITLKDGSQKRIELERVHMEEDTGKSLHLEGEDESLLDLNRAGTPLLEIVTKPCIRTAEEAGAFVTEVRKFVRYLEISDGNMDEGSLRCDANVSVMLKDATEFGKRCEVKNMNSIRNVQRAIEFEIDRQIELVENGEPILQQTRLFDAETGTTRAMRSKEDANDYRYFPEPDLQPVIVDKAWIDRVKADMPSLPHQLIAKFTEQFKLPEYDAKVLTEQKDVALFFESLCEKTDKYKQASNWVMGPVKSYVNERALTIAQFPISVEKLADLIALIADGKVSNSVAEQRLFPALLDAPEKDVEALAKELDLLQEGDEDAISAIVDEVIASNPAKVEEYKNGKKGLLGMFMGQVMKKSKGKADPKLASKLLEEKLN